jgi:hypothetical protein
LLRGFRLLSYIVFLVVVFFKGTDSRDAFAIMSLVSSRWGRKRLEV